jgi:heme oxygenase
VNWRCQVNLKELTWENHKSAERKKFASVLMSGNIDPALYHRYLVNQFYNYVALEYKMPLVELGLRGINRAELISEDIIELEDMYGLDRADVSIAQSTKDYAKYCEELYDNNKDGLIAHMYVRHFGDMYGGAMIAKRIPGSGMMYKFENVDTLKTTVRGMLDDSMAPEANRCFEFAIRLFEELLQ